MKNKNIKKARKVVRKPTKRSLIPVSFKLIPQTYGINSTTLNIERSYVLEGLNTQTEFVSVQNFLNTREFKTTAKLYRYFKLNSINLAVQPQSSTVNIKALMVWTDDDEEITTDDSTKIIAVNAMRWQFMSWRIPNCMMPTGLASGVTTVNPKDWIISDDIYTSNDQLYHYPGRLLLTRDQTGTVKFIITCKFTFRGSKLNAENVKLNNRELMPLEESENIAKDEMDDGTRKTTPNAEG